MSSSSRCGAQAPRYPGRTYAWWLAARPKTLPLSVWPVLLGVASVGESWSLWVLLPLCTGVSLQVGVNLHNDAADALSGVDGPRRLGPPRAVASGWLSAQSVRRAAYFCYFCAGCTTLPFFATTWWWVLPLYAACLGGAIGYSGIPHPLSHRKLGEVLAWVFFGPVPSLGSAFLLFGKVSAATCVLGVCCGCYAFATMLINNLRDMTTDRLAGKSTLPMWLGENNARLLLVACVSLPPLFTAIMLAQPWLFAPLILAGAWSGDLYRITPQTATQQLLRVVSLYSFFAASTLLALSW